MYDELLLEIGAEPIVDSGFESEEHDSTYAEDAHG